MRDRIIAVVVYAVLALVAETVDAQLKDGNFPAPPEGFDARREGIDRGKVEAVEYDSTTIGTKRRAHVYTPPGYSKEQQYPVLYLLHGIGGDENEWLRGGAADVILDNLLADKELAPMIVVFPNGRAAKDVTRRDPIPKQSPAFAAFEKDLLRDLIPFIEKTYPVKADRESRAVAGLSIGAGQALNFGLHNLDTFAWVGGFSSAPNTKPPADLINDPAQATKKLWLLYVACGDRDRLFRITQGVYQMLDEKKVPHVYRVIPGGGHDFAVWKNDLYHFAQLVFRQRPPASSKPQVKTMLIEPTELVKRLEEPRLRILDTRPQTEYAKQHVPGAVHVDVKSWQALGKKEGGFHDAKAWAEAVGQLGIGHESDVVVYGSNPTDTARIWWTLKYLGLENVAILNGGWKVWLEEKHSTDDAAVKVEAVAFDPKFQADRLAELDALKKAIPSGKVTVVDARSAGEYTGAEVRGKRGGHIPGSKHLEWKELLAEDGRFKSPEKLRELFREREITPDKTAVTC